MLPWLPESSSRVDPRFRKMKGLPNPDYNIDGEFKFDKKLTNIWDVIVLDCGKCKFDKTLKKIWVPGGAIDLDGGKCKSDDGRRSPQ